MAVSADPAAKLLTELCHDLQALRAQARGPSIRALAGRLGMGKSQVGAILNGQIRTLPDWQVVRGLVQGCYAYAHGNGRLADLPSRPGLEEYWRLRYAVLEHAFSQPRAPQPETPRSSGLPVAPRQLPRQVAHLVGRRAELAALANMSGPITISGVAGVGKTSLAVWWAHQVAQDFPDGQLYVNLRGFDPSGTAMSVREAVRSFLDALGVAQEKIPPGEDAQIGLYRSLLAQRRMLVLLDNAHDAEQVRPLLPGSSGCLALVTSRNQLTPLVATEGAHPLTLDLLPPPHARELLVRRLGADRVVAEPQAVNDIIARCAGLPLALAVAAARAATRHGFSLAVLAAQLRDASDRLDTLRGGDAATDIRTVFSWSYRVLSPDAARLFRLLGLPPGADITSPAAASLAGIPIQQARTLLAELTDAHLLTEHSPGRYTLHDLLRDYAAEQAQDLDDEQTRRAALNRILDHYLHAAHTATLLLGPAPVPSKSPAPPRPEITTEKHADHDAALAWFTAERAVILAAIEHAAEAGFYSHAWQLAWTLSTFLVRQGLWRDQEVAQTIGLAAARRAGDLTAQANALLGLGLGYSRSGQEDRACPCLDEAVDLFAAVGDRAGQAAALEILAWLSERQGRLSDALSTMQRGLELVRPTEHRLEAARLLNGVGWCHALLGEYERAVICCEEALVLCQELNDRNAEAATWDSLGYAHLHLGNHRQAITSYQRSVDLYSTLADGYNEATTLAALGDVHHDAGHLHPARQAWQTAVEILDRLGHPDADPIRAKLLST
jgi:tetratricopeptide (TPR) repeat protein